jgi:hypothetical protein
MGMVMLMVVVIMVMMVVVVGMVILWSHWLKSAKEFTVVTCEGTICKPRTQEMIFKIFNFFLNYCFYRILDCFDFNLLILKINFNKILFSYICFGSGCTTGCHFRLCLQLPIKRLREQVCGRGDRSHSFFLFWDHITATTAEKARL